MYKTTYVSRAKGWYVLRGGTAVPTHRCCGRWPHLSLPPRGCLPGSPTQPREYSSATARFGHPCTVLGTGTSQGRLQRQHGPQSSCLQAYCVVFWCSLSVCVCTSLLCCVVGLWGSSLWPCWAFIARSLFRFSPLGTIILQIGSILKCWHSLINLSEEKKSALATCSVGLFNSS